MSMTSDSFLVRKTAELCREHFSGKQVSNLLVVRWGKPWKSKLGHIKPLKNAQYGSLIEINSLLKDPRVPEFVIEATLLHELVHYFDGFGSNHPRSKRFPHKGGSISKEFEKMGWTELSQKQESWIKENFGKLWKEKFPQQKKRFVFFQFF